MDTEDTLRLAAHLTAHGPTVTVNGAESRLRVTSSLNDMLSEKTVATGDRYGTSFDYEIGGRGHERACAERFAQLLAVGTATRAAPARPRTAQQQPQRSTRSEAGEHVER
ncbi:hypothetical protein AB0Q95_45540 [Streptomyces sp. NPDC059900]|uniref:hypothetical protein n=1 Tax=Streptomyces sp. NPDC059900 TaxID=3155816 RepID=UPI00342129B0